MKKMLGLLTALLPILLLSGCTQYGKLNEGDCKGVISFADVTNKTFTLMDEELREQVKITVRLKNITTEKEYRIQLDQSNDYKQAVSLHPGTYRIVSAVASNSGRTGVKVKATAETLEFAPGNEQRLDIVLEDPEALKEYWANTQPLPEILLADKYSGMIQINRKVIPVKDILSELSLSGEQTVAAYQKETVRDGDLGITVTVQNRTDSPLAFDQCDVIGITVTANTVVFPDGVSIGASTDKVCHKVTGLYGEPTAFRGSTLFGWDIDETYAVYSDPATGNRITLAFGNMGKYIKSVQYELAVFE